MQRGHLEFETFEIAVDALARGPSAERIGHQVPNPRAEDDFVHAGGDTESRGHVDIGADHVKFASAPERSEQDGAGGDAEAQTALDAREFGTHRSQNVRESLGQQAVEFEKLLGPTSVVVAIEQKEEPVAGMIDHADTRLCRACARFREEQSAQLPVEREINLVRNFRRSDDVHDSDHGVRDLDDSGGAKPWFHLKFPLCPFNHLQPCDDCFENDKYGPPSQ